MNEKKPFPIVAFVVRVGARWRERPHRPLFWLLLSVYVFFSFQGLGGYFLYGHAGFAGGQRAAIARNYVEYGLVETGGKPVIDFGIVAEPKQRHVHWHHPPGVNLLVAASFWIFGESEAAARLVPVLMGIACFLFMHRLANGRYGPRAALVVCTFYTFLPMRFCYGNMVNYEVPVMACVLYALVELERFRKSSDRRSMCLAGAGLVLSLLAAGFIDWPAFIFAAFVGLDAILRPPRRPLLFIVIGVATTLFLVCLFLWLSSGETTGSLSNLAKYRAGASGAKLTFGTFLNRMERHATWNFGYVPLLLSAGWILWSLGKRRFDPVINVFLCGTVVYLLLFKQAAMKHEFYLNYLTPAVAWGAGMGVVDIVRRFRGRAQVAVAVAAAVFVVSVETPTLLAASKRAHGVRTKGSKTFPAQSAVDQVLIGKLVRDMSKPGDLILLHRSVPDSVQMKYYMARNTRMAGSTFPSKGRLFVARASSLPKKLQQKLVSERPVVAAFGYLIFDLTGKGPHVTAYDFRALKPTLWWRYARSNHYPPHVLSPNAKSAKRYAKRLGVKQ